MLFFSRCPHHVGEKLILQLPNKENHLGHCRPEVCRVTEVQRYSPAFDDLSFSRMKWVITLVSQSGITVTRHCRDLPIA